MVSTASPPSKVDFVRTQALQSTQRLLAVHGLSLTMDQIAVESGISRRSLFRHFESRDALVGAALEATLADYEQQLEAAAEIDGPLTDWLAAVVEHTHRSHLAAGLAMWQISSTAETDLAPEFREVNRHRRELRRRATRRLTEQAWRSGGGDGTPPDAVAEVMAMAMSSFSTQSLIVDLGQSIPEAAHLSAAIISAVIAAHLPPMPHPGRRRPIGSG